MTPEQFVIWLRGFAQAANNFTLTPKQWDDIRDKLASVDLSKGSVASNPYTLEGNSTTTKTLLTDNTIF